tara:strand:- start:861 stop:1346 length:486 start_codon:yes stop_codon:yes gene_type:complete
MSTLASIINQVNSLTGYMIPSASGYIISSSQPVGSGSVNDLINQINTITGFNIPYTSVTFVSGSNVGQPIYLQLPSTAPSGTIPTEGIYPGAVIKADHVLRIINALNGVNANDIIIAGTLAVSGSSTMESSLNLPFIPNEDLIISVSGSMEATNTIDGGTF